MLYQMLPEKDIANMSDVIEVRTPSEIIEWQIKRIVDHISRTPVLQNICE